MIYNMRSASGSANWRIPDISGQAALTAQVSWVVLKRGRHAAQVLGRNVASNFGSHILIL